MAPPFSVDFRWRVVWLSLVHGKSPAAIASLLGICERTARRYLDSFQRTGDVLPKKHRSGPLPLLGEFEQLTLVRLLSQNPCMKLMKNF
jgi:transposase